MYLGGWWRPWCPRDGRVVATQGDPDAPVNRGLNCIKGYFLAKIMYGKDRLTSPMLRMKDGKYDKGGGRGDAQRLGSGSEAGLAGQQTEKSEIGGVGHCCV